MLDEKGFKKKNADELIDDMTAKAKELFGEETNLSEKSFLGILIRLFAWFLAIVWEIMERVYNNGFIKKAEGVALDYLAPTVGTSRLLEDFAKGTIEIKGPPQYVLYEGTLTSTSKDVFFYLISDVTLDSSGNGIGEIVAVDPGSLGNVETGEINELVNPDINILSITNPTPTIGGRDREDHESFRNRMLQVGEGTGAGTISAIRSALLSIPSVRAATVVENDTDQVDEQGRRPHSFECYVLGGSPIEIGQAIIAKKPGGIGPFGEETVIVQDDSGVDKTIHFTYATDVRVEVKIQLQTSPSFPIDGLSRLKTSFVQYVGGQDVQSTYTGLNMGDDVIYTKFIALAYKIEGVEDVTIQMGV